MSERSFDEYCTCGAQQNIIDGYFTCTPSCLATYLKAHPDEEYKYNDNLARPKKESEVK